MVHKLAIANLQVGNEHICESDNTIRLPSFPSIMMTNNIPENAGK